MTNATFTYGDGIYCDGHATIYNNYIYGCEEGVTIYTERESSEVTSHATQQSRTT